MSGHGSSTEVRFHALDVLRGLAAIFVVIHHGLSPFGMEKLWVPHAQLSVDLFFALSGFVLAAAYETRLRAGLGWRSFMRGRAIRLYPLALAGLALGLGVSILRGSGGSGDLSWVGVMRSLLLNAWLLPDLLPGAGAAWLLNVPLWSLSVELLLSLLFCTLAWRLSTRQLWLCWACAAVALMAWAVHHGDVSGGHDRQTWLAGPVRGLVSFLAGHLIWRLPVLWQRTSHSIAWPVACLSLMILWPSGPWNVWLEPLMVLLWAPTTVVLAAGVGSARVSVLSALGTLSFPLYALHYPMVQLGSAWARRHHMDDGVALVLIVAVELVAALMLAHVALLRYDTPVRRWIASRVQPAGNH